MSGRRQRGVALITVLLVVALATVAAAEMTADSVFDRRRAANRLALEQAHQVALGGEDWSISALAQDAEEGNRDSEFDNGDANGGDETGDGRPPVDAVDSLDEDWAQPLPPIPVEGGQVGGRITDAQGRFNVNGLVAAGGVDAVALMRFQRLLAVLGLERRIAMAVVDWIDADSETTYPGGAEDNFYGSLAEPYRAANRPLATASELRLVRGIDATAWRALAPHVTALPTPTPINVNTADPVLLQAIVPDLDGESAQALADAAADDPFTDVAAFQAHERVASAGVEEAGLAVRSRHFRSRVDVELGPVTYTLFSWLQRDHNGALRVLRRARTPN